jgi:REP element-mobilizing transposase RayT
LRNEIARITAPSNDSNPHLVKEQLERLDEFERKWFVKFEDILHKSKFGPSWLKDERIAMTVAEGLHELDHDAYRLDAYSIMSNHVHAVFKPLLTEDEVLETYDPNGGIVIAGHPSLSRIMQSLKGRSARSCNKLLGRVGQFWEHENFDRIIRTDRFNSTVRYVLNNRLKQGLLTIGRNGPGTTYVQNCLINSAPLDPFESQSRLAKKRQTEVRRTFTQILSTRWERLRQVVQAFA